MALVYLSPSGPALSPLADTGKENHYMQQIADEMELWFRASGISFHRNEPDMTDAQNIAASNEGQYALHLALHASPAPVEWERSQAGATVFYSPYSRDGQVAAELIANHLRGLYPDPRRVQALPTDSIGQVIKVCIPSAFVEFTCQHGSGWNPWMGQKIRLLAEAVARAVAEYFGLPCLVPQPVETGVADLQQGVLHIRTGPSLIFPVIAQVQDGAPLTICHRYRNWFVVQWNDISGYALQDSITVGSCRL